MIWDNHKYHNNTTTIVDIIDTWAPQITSWVFISYALSLIFKLLLCSAHPFVGINMSFKYFHFSCPWRETLQHSCHHVNDVHIHIYFPLNSMTGFPLATCLPAHLNLDFARPSSFQTQAPHSLTTLSYICSQFVQRCISDNVSAAGSQFSDPASFLLFTSPHLASIPQSL